MNEIALKLCDIQGRLFELSADHNYSSMEFIKLFIGNSKIESLVGGEVYSKDVLYWIGYIYRYWHYYSGEDSRKIYKQAPVEVMKRNYMMFHTMDPVLAIENLKEIYNQKR